MNLIEELDTALATVRSASVLAAEDAASLDALAGELRQTWDTVQIFRTRTEMEYSVLDDIHHPTPDAKYWQCQREQNVMFGELVSLSYEYRKNDIELRMELRKLEAEQDELARELIQVEIDRRRFTAANMQRVAADRMREIRHWHEIKAALLPQMKHGADDCDAHQRESLPIRFERQAAMVTPAAPPADRINLIGLHTTAQARMASPLTMRPMTAQLKAVA